MNFLKNFIWLVSFILLCNLVFAQTPLNNANKPIKKKISKVIYDTGEQESAKAAFTITASPTNTCPGLCEGTIRIELASGTPVYPVTLLLGHGVFYPSYSYPPVTINDASGFPYTFTGLCGSGIAYGIKAFDAEGTTRYINNIPIVEYSEMQVIDEVVIEPLCNGDNNGSILINNINNANYPIDYIWNRGDFDTEVDVIPLTNVEEGQWIVTVTDAEGCVKSFTYDITAPVLLTLPDTHRNIQCKGNCDGFIHINPTGGTLPYTVIWADGPSDLNRDNLCPNTYSVTVTDDHNCSVNNSWTLTEPEQALFAQIASFSNPTCPDLNNGTVTGTGTGGTRPYTFTWSFGGPYTVDSIATGLTAMCITLNLSDANDCPALPVEQCLAPPTLPDADAFNNGPKCDGASLTLSSSGGDTYHWEGPNAFESDEQNPVINPVTEAAFGTYTVTVTNTTTNCSSTATTDVVINPLPTVTPLSNSPVCVGEDINLISNGGISYQWSGPDSFVSGNQNPTSASATLLDAGTYHVTVIDANGCQATASTDVVVNELPNAIAGNNGPICAEQTLNLTSGGGTNYSWSGPLFFTSLFQNPSITGATEANAGVYTVIVTDGNGCEATATTNVVINELPTATIGSNSPVCVGQSLNLTAGGGTSYDWDGPNLGTTTQNPIINPVALSDAGTYSVTVSESGCSKTLTTDVTVNPIPDITANPLAQTICSGDATSIALSSSTPGATFTWTVVQNGVTGATACNVACGNNIGQTLTYSDVPGTATYTVTPSANNCSGTSPATVVITVSPISVGGTASAAPNPICTGSNTTLTLAGYTGAIQWQSSPDGSAWTNIAGATTTPYTTTGGITATTYYRAVVTSGVCSSANSTSVTVTVSPLSVGGTASADPNPVCTGSNTTLTLAGYTGTIQWQSSPDGSAWSNIAGATTTPYTTAGGITATTYYRAVVTSGTCSPANSTTVTVTVSPLSVGGTASAAPNPVCTGSNTTLTLVGYTGTIQWQSSPDGSAWSNIAGATTTPYTTTGGITATTYYRAVVTSGTCASANSTTVTVTVSPLSVGGTASAAPNPVCTGSNTTLTLAGYTGTIQWQSSPDGSAWTNIAGATTTPYTTTGGITATTYYRAVVTSGACSEANSTTVTVTVSPLSVGGTASAAPNPVCTGSNTTLTLAGYTGTIQWQSSPDGSAWTNIAGATTTPYTTTGGITATTFYRAVVTSGACSSANSTSVTVTVSPLSVGGTASADPNPVCTGSNTTLTLAGYTGTIQWQSSPNGSAWTNIAGATTTPYTTTGGITATTYYRAVVTSGTCSPANSTTVTVIVNTESTPPTTLTATPNPVCPGTSTTITFSDGSLGTGATWQWYSGSCGGTSVGSGTSITVNPVSDTIFYVRAEGVCNTTTCDTVNVSISTFTAAICDSGMSCGSLPTVVSGTTFLPDGNGVSYTTTITHDVFGPTQTITSASDIQSITAKMEHSYLGDLKIELICPNDQSIVMKNYPGGGSTFLGEPIDFDAITGPGVGYVYSWKIGTTDYGTMLSEANSHFYTYTDVVGNTYNNHTYLPAGSYQPSQDFSGLIGCPLNGNWTIKITDNMNSDNGYIFWWRLDFKSSLFPDQYCNGFAEVCASGGIPDYTYQWSNGENTSLIDSLCAESYCVTVTDGAGCTASDCVVITNVDMTLTTTKTDPTCFGDCDGTITATPGGSVGYTYLWNTIPAQTTASISGLCAGTYIVTVTEANGCYQIDTIYIIDPPEITLTQSSVNITCSGQSDGTITLIGGGGTPPYEYSITTGCNAPLPDWNNSGDFTALSVGSYTPAVKDANGCCIEGSVIDITSPSLIVASISPATINLNCYGDTTHIHVTVTGGTQPYTYDIGDGPQTSNTFNDLTGSLAGTEYIVNVTDDNSCPNATATVTIYTPDQLNTVLPSPINLTCSGDLTSATVTINGGTPNFSYIWTNGQSTLNTPATTNTATDLGEGTWYVDITDGSPSACTTRDTVDVIVPNPVTATVTSSDLTACPAPCDGHIHILASGGTPPYTYSYNGATGNFTASADSVVLCAGSYNVVVRDNNGCEYTYPTTITLIQPNGPTLTNVTTHPNCYGGTGTIVATASGSVAPYTFSIDGGPFTSGNPHTFSSVTCGIHDITVQSSNNCFFSIQETVVCPPQLVAEICDSIMSCGSLPTVVSGTTFLPDGQGVPYTTTITHDVFDPSQIITSANDIEAICASMEHSYSGDLNIIIRCPNNQFATLKAGYSGGNRTLGEPVMVGHPDSQSQTLLDPGLGYTYCWEASAPFTMGGAPQIFHNYTDAVGTFQNNIPYLPAGSYQPEGTLTDLIGCPLNGNWTIEVEDLMGLDNGYIFWWRLDFKPTLFPDEYCGGSATVCASGGTPDYSYMWNNSETSTMIDSLCAGDFCVTVTDAVGCTASDCVTITNVDISTNVDFTPVLCNGDSTDGWVVASGGSNLFTYLWSTLSTNDSIYEPTGTYYVTVTDTVNFCHGYDTLIITAPNPLIITDVTIVPAGICHNDTATITIVASGGTGGLSYSYGSGPGETNTTGIFHGMPPASYSFTVTDVVGCTDDTSFTIVNPPGINITNQSFTNASCFGICNGTITITASGGTGALWYYINSTPVDSNQTGIFNTVCGSLTPYVITVKDASNCFVTSTPIFITQPTEIAVTSQNFQSITTCYNDCNGSITVTTSGGVNPITYNMGGTLSNNTGSFTDLCAGIYSMTITDNSLNQCEATVSPLEFILTQPTQITATSTSSSANNDCFGECNGTITITASGGTGTLSYSIDGSSWTAGSGAFASLCANTYTLSVKDENNCTVTPVPGTATITTPPELVIDSITNTPYPCNGDTMSVTVYASGGTPNYLYEIDNSGTPAMPNVFHGVQEGTHTLSVIDFEFCRKDSAWVAPVAVPLSVAITAQTAPLCHNGTNGSMTATVSGGTPPFDYAWSTGTTVNNSPLLTNTQNGLSSETISVTVTDSSNPACIVNVSATLANPDTIEITKVVAPPTCGLNDGSIDITVTGGTPGFTFVWSNSPITEDIGSLGAGVYTVTATDSHGCEQTDITTLTNPNAPVVTFTNVVHINCNGQSTGSATVEANGGTLPYNIPDWEGPIPYTYAGWNASGLAAGDYSVSITDAAGCEGIGTLTIIPAPAIVIQTFDSTNISCFGLTDGTVTVTASGGTGVLHFTLNGSTQDNAGNFTGLAANTYTLTITDDVPCEITRDVTLIEPADIIIDSQVSQNINCHDNNNGTITVSASGGTGAFWYHIDTAPEDSNQTGIFNPLAAGDYTVTVEDANLCSKTTNLFTIINPPGISVTQDIVNPNCGVCNGSITVHVTGGSSPYGFAWSVVGIDSIATNLCAGSPEVTITDNNGCADTVTYTLNNPAAGIIYFNEITSLTCAGDTSASIEVNMSGGTIPFTYTWNVASHHLTGNPLTDTLAINLGSGTYSVTVIDGNDCQTSKDTTLTNPTDIQILSENYTDITCNGLNDGTISISASAGPATLNYCIYPGPVCNTSGNFTSLAEGDYIVTITNIDGCTKETNLIHITDPDLIEVNISSQNSNCNLDNGMAQVAATGGSGSFSYDWYDLGNNPNTLVTGLAPGTYHVSVTDDVYSCSVVNAVTIEDIAPGTLTFIDITNNTCPGYLNGSVTATVIGGNHPMTSWLWSNGATDSTISSLSCGWYRLTVTDSMTCQKIDSVEITCPPEISISTNDTNINCYGASTGSITATAIGGNGGFTYTLDLASNSNGYFAGLNAGEYIISVTDALGCTMSDTTTLTQSSEIFASPAITFPNCGQSNGSISLNVTGGNPGYNYSWIWSAGTSTNASLTNLFADTYNLTITDLKNCTKDTVINVINPDAGVLSFNPVIHNQCFGFCNGSATAVMTGGVPPYTFTWSNGTSGATITGLCSGIYTVSVEDFNGCFTQGSIEITSPPQLFIDANVSVAIYCNGNLGAISATATGGSGLFSYSIVNPVWQSTGLFENLTANTYIITAKDSNQCTISSTPVNLTEPAAITLNESFTDITCNNSNDGEINVVASGGTLSFLYQFSGSSSWDPDGTYTDLAEGSYYVIVADANGCRDTTDLLDITNPTVLSLTPSSIQSHCGEADGEVSITVSGGSPAYTYLWPYNGNTTNTLTGIPAGCYTVIVTDSRGCTDSTTICFNDNGPGEVTFSGITGVTCYGENTGGATAILSGATAVSYLWSSGEITATATQLSVGENTVVITADFVCIYSSQVNIPGPDAIDITVTSQNVKCFGDNDAFIAFSVTGGTPLYEYSITDGPPFSTNHNFTGLSAGTYQTLVKDANNCLKQGPLVTITQPDEIILSTPVVTHNKCFGECTGSINFSASGGIPSYDYTINGFDVFPAGTFNTLCAGNYTILVTDMNGCTKTSAVIPVLENSQITLAFLIDTPTCGYADGSVQVIPSGGSPSVINGYSYAWGPPSFSISSSITNVGSGVYTVAVTDSLNCSVEGIAALSDSGVGIISIDTLVHNPCYGYNIGWAVATITGGTPNYAFTWSSGATQASSSLVTDTAFNFAAGNHWVKVTDTAGCSTTEAFVVTQPQQIQLSLEDLSDALCYESPDGSFTIGAQGGTPGYSYTLLTATPVTQISPTFGGLTAGTYSIQVTDTNTCQRTRNGIVIDQPEEMVITAATDSSNCNLPDGRAVAIWVYGGTPTFDYLWDSNAGDQTTQTAINLASGVYEFTVTDDHGCTKSASAIVSDKGTPALSFTNVAGENCNGDSSGTATVVVTGGVPTFTFEWTNGDLTTSADSLWAGTHWITVTDGNGCRTYDSVIINAPQPISINPDTTHVNCFGLSTGSISLNASGGSPPYQYAIDGSTFSDNGGIFTNLAAGTYVTTIRDLTLCQRSDTFEILQSPQIVLDIASDSSTCGFNDGAITVHATGGTPYDTGYVYTWNAAIANDSVATGLGSGFYNITVTDSLLCEVTATVPLSDIGAGALTIDSVEHNKCNGDTNGLLFATVTGIPGTISYLWTDSDGNTISTSQLADNLPAGVYLLTTTDESICHLYSQDTITEPDLITLSETSANVLCYGENSGTITISASGGTPGYMYIMGNDTSLTGVFEGLTSGTFNIFVIDTNACQKDATPVIISQPPQILANATSTNSNCLLSTGTATVTPQGGTGTIDIIWSDPDDQTTATATGLSAGIYYVTLTDENSCSATDTVYITDIDAGTIAFNPVTQVLCHGDSTGNATVIITGGIPLYHYLWMNGDTTAFADTLWAEAHWVKVTDAAGCISVDTILIAEPDAIQFDTLIVTDANCYGSSDGTIHATVTGGTQPCTFLVNGTTYSDIDFTDVPADTYIIEVTDANFCKENLDIIVGQPEAIQLTGTADSSSCNVSNGIATVYAEGGTPDYTYLWSDNQTNASAFNLSAGDYWVTVSDNHNCKDSMIFFINDEGGPILTIDNVSHNPCFGDALGQIIVSATGGTPGYTYEWNTNPVQTTSTATNLTIGYYSVEVTDSEGCKSHDSTSIFQPDELLITYSDTAPSCYGVLDGSLIITASGGTLPYEYTLNTTTQSTGVFTQIGEGLYDIIVEDGNNCQKVFNDIAVTGPTPIIIIATESNPTCAQNTYDGAISLLVTGGTPGYTYLWSNNSTSQNLINLQGGTYVVTVTDQKNCTEVDTSVIEGQIEVNANAGADTIVCHGDSIMLNATGGTSYLWSPSNFLNNDTSATPLASPVTSTEFILMAFIGNCYDTDTVQITLLPIAEIEAGPDVTLLHGYTTTLQATCDVSGTTFEWIPGEWLSDPTILNPVVSPDATTTFYLYATSPNGCVAKDSVNIKVIPVIQFTEGFSPNDDGNNDKWIIRYFEYYSDIEVSVYNRWGELLFHNKNCTDFWDGKYKGKHLPVGSYYYVITYLSPEGRQVLTGPVTIVR